MKPTVSVSRIAAALVRERAGGRVEGVEEPLPHPDPGAGQGVEQRRLAGVRVAGEGDRGQRGPLALGPHHGAVALHAPAAGGAAR